MEPFGVRLWCAVGEHGPLCVGIDPHAELLHSLGLPDDAGGAERFGRRVVEALAGQVAVVKPQAAFFERFGSAGIRALESVLADARDARLLCITDRESGGIGAAGGGHAR